MEYEYDPDDVRLAENIRFSDFSREKFRKFVVECRSLESASWISEGMPAGYMAYPEPDEILLNFTNWEQIQVVLHRIRPFVLKDETTYFFSIRKQLLREIKEKIDTQEFTRFLKAVKILTERFGGIDDEFGVAVEGYGNIMSMDFLMDYLNSSEYHRSQEPADRILAARKLGDLELKGILSITIHHIVKSIFVLRDIILSVASDEDLILLA